MTTLTHANTLFSPLFEDSEIEALFSTEAVLVEFTRFEAALTRALGNVGIVGSEVAQQAIAAMESFEPDVSALADRIKTDGVAVPGYVGQLKAHVGAEYSKVVHIGTTSQDLVDSALAAALGRAGAILEGRLNALFEALDVLCSENAAHGLMGRTRMQSALPISVNHRVATWCRPLVHCGVELAGNLPEIARLQLGGPVGTREAYGTHGQNIADQIAAELGLHSVDHSWHTDRHAWVAFGDLLSRISGALGKIGQDVCLMAQQGIEDIVISSGGGSSAMPHKQNPIDAELLVTLARFNAVQVGGLHQVLVHEQERSGVMWALEWMILAEMVRATGRGLLAANDLLGRIARIGN